MLDDLRNSAANSFQDDDDEEQQKQAQKPRDVIRIRPISAPSEPFLGMTPEQRFVVALLIFLMVTVLGVLLLVATHKVFIY